MKLLLQILLITIIPWGSINAFEYKDADLIFQVSGHSPFSEAITSATGSPDSLSYVHVGIIHLCPDGSLNVIEASPEVGVRELPLEEFLSESIKINGKPGVVIKRIKVDIPVSDIIRRAQSFLGQPYDWYYLPDNEMLYCSELIYESYLDENGEHIFTANPMNFRAPDGSMPEFWTNLYQKLGIDVPEGIPGTNPNDISRDPQLKEVYRFFRLL